MNRKLTKEERKQLSEQRKSQPRDITENDLILLQEHFGNYKREKENK